VLAQDKQGAIFKRFEPQQTQIVMRIGGQHPFKNDPGVVRQFNRTVQAPTQYAVIATSPNTKVKMTTRTSNGGLLEEFYELRPANNTLVRYGVGSCTGCNQATMLSIQNFSGPEVIQWCSGGVGG
jgi:hypothetical protein